MKIHKLHTPHRYAGSLVQTSNPYVTIVRHYIKAKLLGCLTLQHTRCAQNFNIEGLISQKTELKHL